MVDLWQVLLTACYLSNTFIDWKYAQSLYLTLLWHLQHKHTPPSCKILYMTWLFDGREDILHWSLTSNGFTFLVFNAATNPPFKLLFELFKHMTRTIQTQDIGYLFIANHKTKKIRRLGHYACWHMEHDFTGTTAWHAEKMERHVTNYAVAGTRLCLIKIQQEVV